MVDVSNLGAAGAPIDAIGTGVTEIIGPNFWFPGTAGNELTSPGFTIPSTLGILPLPFTDGALTILATDVPAASANSFTASTGQTVVVGRSITGPVTLVAPTGVVEIANPDETNALNNLAIPDDAAFSLGSLDDLVIVWTGQLGNVPATASFFDGQQLAPGVWFTVDAGLLSITIDDGANKRDASLTVPVTGFYDHVCIVGRLSRTTAMMDVSIHSSNTEHGHYSTETTVNAGTVEPVDPVQILTNLPGGVTSFAWNKGPGARPTNDELDAIAAYFLAAISPRAATMYTGKYPPPLNERFTRDCWTANNGHVAEWHATQVGDTVTIEWLAISPTVDNVAALLGNSQLWIGADS